MTPPQATEVALAGNIGSARSRAGIALALSGGGFRATLFHLGAVRRLHELGVLSQLDYISSVSGGTLLAAFLAEEIARAGGVARIDVDVVARAVRALSASNLRRRVILRRLLPWHWMHSLARLVARDLDARLAHRSIADLPERPRFLLCATDMVFGVNWIYARDRAGDFQAGYRHAGLDEISLGHATAASACFPPVFKPIDCLVAAAQFSGGDARGAEADRCRARIVLTDGGVYDNMALEPTWKSVATQLVSDAGGPFEFADDRGLLRDIQRYTDIMGNQARALRKRWLIDSFTSHVGPDGGSGFGGAYWGTVSYRARYDPSDRLGYAEPVASAIAQIRTDLDAFSDAEAAILENHGYLMADIAVKVHVPSLYSGAPIAIPHPDWLAPTKVLAALRHSAKRRLL